MSRGDHIEAEGTVTECHKGEKFTVVLDGNDHQVLGHLAGRLRKNRIRVLPHDRVICELSPYSMDLCRIVYRHRD